MICWTWLPAAKGLGPIYSYSFVNGCGNEVTGSLGVLMTPASDALPRFKMSGVVSAPFPKKVDGDWARFIEGAGTLAHCGGVVGTGTPARAMVGANEIPALVSAR